MGLALAFVSQSLSNRRMCAVGQAPRVLGPFPSGFLCLILSGTVSCPFCYSYSSSLARLYAVVVSYCKYVTEIGKATPMEFVALHLRCGFTSPASSHTVYLPSRIPLKSGIA
jgi:hypothetical protein